MITLMTFIRALDDHCVGNGDGLCPLGSVPNKIDTLYCVMAKNVFADDKEVQEFLNNSVAFKTKIESIQKGEIDLNF